MAGERRRDYMVSKRVHRLYLMVWVSCVALVAAFLFMVYKLKGVSLPESTQSTLVLVGVLAFAIVCLALFLAVYTVVHTHRLMGSAYRIGMVTKEINAGKPIRINLRDGDFFTEIADEINILADSKTDSKGSAGGGGEKES